MEIPERTLVGSELDELALYRPPPPEGDAPRWLPGSSFADTAASTASTDQRPHAGARADPLPLSTAYQYALTFAQVHPGFDTVVMPRGMLPEVIDIVGSVFVGFPPVGGLLAEAVSHLDRSCVTTRHVPVTFHVGKRNGQWGVNTTWDNSTGSGAHHSSPSNPSNRPARSDTSALLDLNHLLAREARDRAVGAAAADRGPLRAFHSRYRVGRRCKEASRLPQKCYAGHYYPQSLQKYVLP